MTKAQSLIGLLLFSLACTDAPVGSKARPFTMYFVPSVDAHNITSSAESMKQFLEKTLSKKFYGKEEGFHIKTAIPTSYVAVVEAFGTNKADFAAITTFSYILARDIKKYDIEALLTVVRADGESTYKGQIIARADSGIKSLQDLVGKKFAYTDPASTSGYILPMRLFKEKNIALGETVFAQKHDNVVTMVYQKQVDAGATFYSPAATNQEGTVEIRDARSRVKAQFPDVEQKVAIVGFTQEIPNEPWVMRRQVFKDTKKNAEFKSALSQALVAYAQTDEGSKFLRETYDLYGLKAVDDSTYADIRKVILTSNMDLQQVIGNEGQKKKKN